MQKIRPVPGKDGDKYVPFEKRTGESSIVFSHVIFRRTG